MPLCVWRRLYRTVVGATRRQEKGNVPGYWAEVGGESRKQEIRPDRDPDPVRRFDCFTADQHRLADWLVQCGVTTVAMQSTGVYWIPLYEILDRRGLEVYLVNARHTRNLPGRKTDVQESQWLLKLHTYGLLRNSFHPDAHIRVVRRQSHPRITALEGGVMNRVWLGALLGVTVGVADVLLMLPLQCPDRTEARLGAFCARFALGSVAARGEGT